MEIFKIDGTVWAREISLSYTDIRFPPIAIDREEKSVFTNSKEEFPFWDKTVTGIISIKRKHLRFINVKLKNLK